ncbi:MAG: 6-carboxytetrahydropterin synthase [Bacteroidales bacterium]|jgi:6-pyruvoyltetrahydropterin/6-carboxytetrahydropterin synthase|nr:6-carboxytetrahydropterin synthase [Bacteroidales bacterium]
MSIVRITKQFTFEMAHALTGYDGLCRNIHGHSYHLDVTVKGTPCQDKNSPKIGMLIDFGDLKKIVNEEIVLIFDHALVLNKKSNAETITLLQKNYEKVFLTTFQPTTENLLGYFAEKLKKQFPAHLKLIALKLRETDSSFAEWYEEDNQE